MATSEPGRSAICRNGKEGASENADAGEKREAVDNRSTAAEGRAWHRVGPWSAIRNRACRIARSRRTSKRCSPSGRTPPSNRHLRLGPDKK